MQLQHKQQVRNYHQYRQQRMVQCPEKPNKQVKHSQIFKTCDENKQWLMQKRLISCIKEVQGKQKRSTSRKPGIQLMQNQHFKNYDEDKQ
mmetsp:Transcript_97511/g.168929  ORF Transcript_97511/g.168929 Transcript_97511/m.168929 type:complete len:90 (+) Transcript_97511:1152-1421(+)